MLFEESERLIVFPWMNDQLCTPSRIMGATAAQAPRISAAAAERPAGTQIIGWPQGSSWFFGCGGRRPRRRRGPLVGRRSKEATRRLHSSSSGYLQYCNVCVLVLLYIRVICWVNHFSPFNWSTRIECAGRQFHWTLKQQSEIFIS
jgi:hypothetical protein